jgi:cytosine/adenosine deaminase-related metal-dependent hydrolase
MVRFRRVVLAPCVVTAALLAACPCTATGEQAPAAPAPVPCPEGATASRVFAFALGGNRAGYETSCVLPDGSRQSSFAFNDRGRGPQLVSRYVLDQRGIPTRVTTDGHDYLKGEIAERFEVTAGRASWTNKVERGGKPLDQPAFYVSQSAPPSELALLARALLRSPGGRLPLLPQGEARVETLGSRQVEATGRSVRVTQYAVAGLGFQPSPVWLDEKGELFAIVDDFTSLVPEGWETTVPVLREQQDSRAEARRAEQARRLRRVPPGPLVFEHASVFDADRAVMRPGTTVVVSGERIRAVFPDGEGTLPPGAERVDAAGRALLPGLFDMHSHPALDDGILYLAAGVTSIRDMAAEVGKATQFRAAAARGALLPRVTFAGIVDGRGPFQGPTKTLVDTEDEARAAVRAMAEAGFPQVKIYSSVKPQLVPVIASEAHRLGMRVSGHIPAFMTAEQAVRDGYDEIQHMNMLFLNFLYDQVQDTRTPARFTAVAEHAAEIDLASPRVRSFLALLKQRKVTIDPTLDVFENLFCDRPGQVAAAFREVADRMPPLVRRGFLEGGLPVPEGKEERWRSALPAMERMLMALRREGIPIVAGTDSLAGFSLPRELELYVEAGIPAPEVLQMATLGAARVLREDDRLGRIAPGMLADMILVDGDPTRRIGDVRRMRLVVAGGAILDPDALCREVGIRPLEEAGTR